MYASQQLKLGSLGLTHQITPSKGKQTKTRNISPFGPFALKSFDSNVKSQQSQIKTPTRSSKTSASKTKDVSAKKDREKTPIKNKDLSATMSKPTNMAATQPKEAKTPIKQRKPKLNVGSMTSRSKMKTK